MRRKEEERLQTVPFYSQRNGQAVTYEMSEREPRNRFQPQTFLSSLDISVAHFSFFILSQNIKDGYAADLST